MPTTTRPMPSQPPTNVRRPATTGAVGASRQAQAVSHGEGEVATQTEVARSW
jgi:hypothetical protein